MALSRRKMLKGAAAAGAAFAPQVVTGQAPAQLTGTQTGRKFKAFVRHGTGASVEELRAARDPAARSPGSHAGLGGLLHHRRRGPGDDRRAAGRPSPIIPAWALWKPSGALVKRVQIGDRVVVPGTPQCGVCYQCLHGRADWCQFLDTAPAHPMAEMSDGTPVLRAARRWAG